MTAFNSDTSASPKWSLFLFTIKKIHLGSKLKAARLHEDLQRKNYGLKTCKNCNSSCPKKSVINSLLRRYYLNDTSGSQLLHQHKSWLEKKPQFFHEIVQIGRSIVEGAIPTTTWKQGIRFAITNEKFEKKN